MQAASLTIAIASCLPGSSRVQGTVASWLDGTKPVSWNKPGTSIPAAPKTPGPIDAKCRELARPPELDEDRRVRNQGWDLVGAYQGGWQTLVIRGTAGYDGMCRPRQYQDFVFVRGGFAGTLSPQVMDSRTDGALSRVFLRSSSQLIAEYQRYAANDPLCCPSRTTTVVFDLSSDPPVLQPVAASTTEPRAESASALTNRPLEGTYWRAIELAGKPTPAQDPKREAHLQFQAEGRVSGSDGCNRITGSFELLGDRVTFGQMVGTQMACLKPSGTEQPFRDALKSAARLTIVGDRLDLFDAKGTRVASFTAGAQGAAPSASGGLAGTSWRLVRFQSSDDTTLTPDDRAKYTIEFGASGQLIARVDCNRGRGTWRSSGPNQVAFGSLALTRAKCPAGSLHDQIVKQWGNIRSYVIREGHLFLALMADGGTYEFEPTTKPKE
jgi:heat shock protein HslJ